MIIASASTVGAVWVMNRRRLYRRSAVPFDSAERAMLAPYFGADLLASTRVVRVEHIANPLVYALLPLIGRRPPMDLAGVSGMALADTIVLAQPKRAINPEGLLFHEMVHIAQYQLLGIHGFVAEYLRGWLRSGRDYFAIPLERHAFELQDRFRTAEAFDVRSELRRLMMDEAMKVKRVSA